MAFTEFVPWVDMIGYAGGVFSLWGMYRNTMIPLRMGAIGGNVGFLLFGILSPSYPTLVLHAVLLPINAYRMFEMMRLIREIREASHGDNHLEPLLPFMHEKHAATGEVLFRKGDTPDMMIIIKEGTVLLEEIGVSCTANEVLGEIGAFTPENRRTCTAVCETDCTLYTLGNDTMMQLFYQNPRFGMFLVRVIVKRLQMNWREADARAHSPALDVPV